MSYIKYIVIASMLLVSSANAASTNSRCEGIIKNGSFTKQFISESNIVSLSAATYDLTPVRGEFEKKENYLKKIDEAKASLNDKVLKETKEGLKWTPPSRQ